MMCGGGGGGGLVTKLCPTLATPWLLCPWDSPGKKLEWVAISFSRGSSWPRDQTCTSFVSCIRQALASPGTPHSLVCDWK